MDRRRGVLRRLRVPHHVAAARRARGHRPGAPRPVLAAPGPAAAAGAGDRAGRRRHGGAGGRHVGRAAGAAAARPAVVGRLPRQLGPDPRRRPVLRRRSRRCCATCGAWRSRSSGTSSGRWCSSRSSDPGSATGGSPACSAALALAAMVLDLLAAHRRARRPSTSLGGVDRVNFMYLSTFTVPVGCCSARRPRSGGGRGVAAARRSRRGRWTWSAGPRSACSACIAGVAALTAGYVYQWLLPLVSVLSLVAVLVVVHPAAVGMRAVFAGRRSSPSASAATACTCGTGRSSCYRSDRGIGAAASSSRWSSPWWRPR